MSATTSGVLGAVTSWDRPAETSRAATRRITPEAGRALEMLGHAIEYLTDEYIHKSGKMSASDSEVAAIHLLMSLNRQVYYACPVARGWSDRIREFFGSPNH